MSRDNRTFYLVAAGIGIVMVVFLCWPGVLYDL
jgi:hypothetical protein